MCTTFIISLSDNKIYGEEPGIYVIKTGDKQVTAKVAGIASVSVEKTRTRYVSDLYFMTSSTRKLSLLNNIVGVNEYEMYILKIIFIKFGSGHNYYFSTI